MEWLKHRKIAIVFWFIVFLHAGSFVYRDTSSMTDAAKVSWSTWGPWSQCNVLNFARETRFRSCVDSKGRSQRSSNCVGHARRIRQCDTCQYPLLDRHRKTNSAIKSTSYKIVHSAGLTQTNTAWCSTRPSFSANEYLEIAFENFAKLTAIATRGYIGKNLNGHVTEYKVKFSYNGKKWFPYEERGREVVFKGNTDSTRLRKNNFETELVARYVRVYPTKYESSVCFDVELHGCEFNCGGLITNDLVRLNSPNSAARIEEPSCLWRIESSEATKIQLSFPFFKLLCSEGVLQIVDGATGFVDGLMFEELCGESRRVLPLEFMGKDLWIHYRAYASTDIGFHLQGNIYAIKTLNSSSGEIHVPEIGDDFKHIFRYTWMIIAPPNSSILLKIRNFKSDNIVRVNGKCVGDSLIIHNSTDIKKSLVKRLCDENFPQTLLSKTSYLRVKFRAESTKPNWKVHFSYKILEAKVRTTRSTDLRQGRDEVHVPSKHPGNGSFSSNDTSLDVNAVKRKNSEKNGSNVPVIISSILAAVIGIVFLVALIHFLRRRKEFLRKHPYDCSTRPMSHFGEEDSTPFINQNVLMWSDSNSRKNDKEKAKKNSLPHITVALREDSPQRLSIIPAEMLSVPPSENNSEEKPASASLVVSDAFTEECLQLLNTNFSSTLPDEHAQTKDEQCQSDEDASTADVQSEREDVQSDVVDVESDVEEVKSDVEVQSEEGDSFDQNEKFSEHSLNLPEKKPAVVLDMPRDFPLTTPEIEKYLAWGQL